MLKKGLCILLTVILLFSLCGCSKLMIFAMMSAAGDDEVSREKIIDYVLSHIEELNIIPFDEIPEDRNEREHFLSAQLGDNTIAKDIYRYNENIVQFYCGGTGLSTNSTYSGFYYSADDTPYAMEFSSSAVFTQTDENTYEWSNSDGTHQFLTERIVPHWFYYYMKWY